MWRMRYTAVLLVVFTIVVTSTAEVYDVTTICRYGVESPAENEELPVTKYNNKLTVEIHGRNNALGLPFLLHNGTIAEPDIGVDFDKCIISTGKCEWKNNKFEIADATLTASQLIVTGQERSLSTSKLIKDIIFSKDFKFSFATSEKNGKFVIFLTDNKSDIKSSDMYIINLTPSGNSDLLECSSKGGFNLYNLPYSMGSRRCAILASKTLGTSHWGHERYEYRYRSYSYSRYENEYYYESRTFIFRVQYSAGSIKVVGEWSGSRHELFEYQDSNHFDVKYIALGTDGGLQVSVKYDAFPVRVLKDIEGSIESPPFVPSSNKLCASVTYLEDTNSSLDLSILRPNDTKLSFMPISTNSLSKGWKTSNYLVQLPDDAMRQNVTIQLNARRSNGSTFLVQRIAGCDGEEMESLVVLENVQKIPDYGYDVAVVKPSSSGEVSLKCLNGGEFDTERQGCVCPAGFIGETCEIGCGENTYGSKCDARCSYTASGCRGMKLCRPNFPCLCAPGLTGHHCDIPCGKEKYGADCRQNCGRCRPECDGQEPVLFLFNFPCEEYAMCDDFTGVCKLGCEAGYFPPYCKEPYKYLTVAPEVSANFVDMMVTVNLDTEHQKGLGTPRFYQIQYTESVSLKWLELEPRLVTAQKVVFNITGLEPATYYQVRVILIDADGDSYQGSEVAAKEIRTKCNVPTAVQYDLHAVEATSDSLLVAWNYTSESYLWCPVAHFEVQRKEHWRWLSYSTQKKMATEFLGLLPGQAYQVRVRVFTTDGPAPFSNILVTNTEDEAPREILQLKLVSKTSSDLAVEWTPPVITAGTIRRYRVTYKCLKLLACSKENCSHSEGKMEVKSNSVELSDLLPHAQYSVSVAALAGVWGPEANILAVTDMAEPGVPPDSSSRSATVEKTNTSFTVQWEPPHNCSRLNGYLYGYRYQLLRHDDSKTITQGNTTAKTAAFRDLKPHTQYTVKVFLDTAFGWSAAHPLSIPVQTMATTPDIVEELTVYKRGRRMLGIRWASPKMTYGDIESFTISYQGESGGSPLSKVLQPTPCLAWPNRFCHKINNLIPDTKYTVLVRARNVAVAEDGAPASVSAVTKESSPEPPPYVRIESQTQTDLAIEWGLPTILNGVLRSFLVNVEETDSFNATDCCQYFPIQEVPVQAEQASYRLLVTDLKPASTYTISVTAKTVTLSPAVTMTAHTRPPLPPMDNLIEMSEQSDVLLTTYEPDGNSIQPTSAENLVDIPENLHRLSDTPEFVIRPSPVYETLISGYLVVVLPQESQVELNATIWNPWLSQEVEILTNGTFYIAAEFKHIDLENSTSFVIGTGSDPEHGKWGTVQNPALKKGMYYRIGLLAILEYCGILNVGYTESDIFQVIA